MSATTEPSSKAEVEQWMNELEARGVPAELECGRCNDPTETTVPPEAKDDETQKTICRSCAETHVN